MQIPGRAEMSKILILNGPNLNMLGIREPDIYGNASYADLCGYLRKVAEEKGIEVSFFQSNHEGAIIDAIQEARFEYDGIVLNAGAYTHYSYAILDAIKSIDVPVAEVHISDPETREEFRHVSVIRPACVFTISGKGFAGYAMAMVRLSEEFGKKVL